MASAANFVFPEELNYFVGSLRPSQLIDVGSSKWLDMHEMMVKLSQQATLEATEHREEEVKEHLIIGDKLKVLVHEAHCVFLWKTRVLPHLLEVDPAPHATFLIYTVFFHEGAAISLLDTALFHGSACEALHDSSIDLVDYCSQGISQLIGLASMGHHENKSNLDVDEAVLSELERQKRDLIYKIGLRSISILNYMADNVDTLPLTATRRMVAMHDVPWLLVDILNFRPWQRRDGKGVQKYIDEKWVSVQGEDVMKVVKYEAQTWFCLRQILLTRELMECYELNEQRCRHLSNCQGLLHESILDQLPPLVELKQYLCHLGVAQPNEARKNQPTTLLMEVVPEIAANLVSQAERDGGFLEIAQRQETTFLTRDKDKVLEFAQRLNAAYNTDLLAEFETYSSADGGGKPMPSQTEHSKAPKSCNYCKGTAAKLCAKCKAVYYCSKICQQEDWGKHKPQCIAQV